VLRARQLGTCFGTEVARKIFKGRLNPIQKGGRLVVRNHKTTKPINKIYDKSREKKLGNGNRQVKERIPVRRREKKKFVRILKWLPGTVFLVDKISRVNTKSFLPTKKRLNRKMRTTEGYSGVGKNRSRIDLDKTC